MYYHCPLLTGKGVLLHVSDRLDLYAMVQRYPYRIVCETERNLGAFLAGSIGLLCYQNLSPGVEPRTC